MTHHLSPRQSAFIFLAFAVCLGSVLWPGAALAQSGTGLRAGVSADPDQFYFGAHFDTGAIAEKLSFRPNVEVGFGNDLTTVALNVEFAYWFDLPTRPWSLYAGGGPAMNIYRWDGGNNGGSHSDAEPGLNLLVGVAHRRGLFGEFKLGLIDSPELKFGIGFTW